jgi:L-methionine (R)-S-oxide reductase
MGGGDSLTPLPVSAGDAARAAHYDAVRARLDALLADEMDWVAAQATVACELHSAFECASRTRS